MVSDPNRDEPERKPTLQPLWVREPRSPDPVVSFNWLPNATRVAVVIPFPWRLVADPVHGAAYLPLWGGHMPLTAVCVYQAAEDQYDGFRFAGEAPKGGA